MRLLHQFKIIPLFFAFFIPVTFAYTQTSNPVLDFMRNNPDKSSFKLIRNGEIVADYHSNRMMPLASTVKVIVAIEYAWQAAHDSIDPDELVALSELEKYYVPDTDGGAHKNWLQSVEQKDYNRMVPLQEVADGMIRFSSNANTEYLCDRLGLHNINNRLKTMGVKDHSEIYHFVSALLIPSVVFPDKTGEELISAVHVIPQSEYFRLCNMIHDSLKKDPGFKSEFTMLTVDVQRVWSDRLPASTTAEYAGIMQKINSRTWFDSLTHVHLAKLLEWPMDNPANAEWLDHAGIKGGSTAFVLTKTMYATDKYGNTTEMALFFNGLEMAENTYLQMHMNQFDVDVLRNQAFLRQVQKSLANKAGK